MAASVRITKCSRAGCSKSPRLGLNGMAGPSLCAQHAVEAVMSAKRSRVGQEYCGHAGCLNYPSFGAEVNKKAEFCASHVNQETVCDSNTPFCEREMCSKWRKCGSMDKGFAVVCHNDKASLGTGAILEFPATSKVIPCHKPAKRGRPRHLPPCCDTQAAGEDGLSRLLAPTRKHLPQSDDPSSGADLPNGVGAGKCKRVGKAKNGVPRARTTTVIARTPAAKSVHGREGCARRGCTRKRTFGVRDSNERKFCSRHAGSGMVYIKLATAPCVHGGCYRKPRYGLLATGAATVCKGHMGSLTKGLVFDWWTQCDTSGCFRSAKWGLAGHLPTRCEKHTVGEDGFVRLVDSATRRPESSFLSIDGGAKRELYSTARVPVLGARANESDIETSDMFGRTCSDVTCCRKATFGFKDGRTRDFCSRHATSKMVYIAHKERPCSNEQCDGKARYGLLLEGAASACARHRGSLQGVVFDFWTRCEASKCQRSAKWGRADGLPTLCEKHAAGTDGFVPLIGARVLVASSVLGLTARASPT